jgi:hypothetical protein
MACLNCASFNLQVASESFLGIFLAVPDTPELPRCLEIWLALSNLHDLRPLLQQVSVEIVHVVASLRPTTRTNVGDQRTFVLPLLALLLSTYQKPGCTSHPGH